MTILAGLVVMLLVTAMSMWRHRVAERALVAARARAHALQAQINPHFFFNTLNTIAALIPDDPISAQETIVCPADMSRYAFATADRSRVSLADELAFVRAYLTIEQARFGDRLRFELPTETDVDGLDLPPLTLQPLVENAVRHGIARRPNGGVIAICVSRDADGFSVVVENDADYTATATTATFFQPSHALMNIRDRLRLVYDGMASIEVVLRHPDRVAVTIRACASP